MYRLLSTLLPLLAVPALVQAECQLANQLAEGESVVETNEFLCKPQGEGSWTFAMENTMVGVPTFNGGQAFAGVVGNNAFILYDHTCTIRGVYDPHDDGNCAIPYVIMENFLEYVLTVTEVNFDLGAGDFTFLYANGAYSIWENQHICTDISNGLQAVEACKAAFPLHGEPA